MGLFKKRSEPPREKNVLETTVEYIQALFGAIVLAVLIRGFVFEPFKIPSESMMPTLLVGDHIFVKRYAYGLRIPFTKKWLTEFEEPVRGDVVVFSFPMDEDVDFIKRVVGLPGDTVTLKAGEVHVNGNKVPQDAFNLAGNDPGNKCWMRLEPEAQSLMKPGMTPYPYYNLIREFQPKVEHLSGVDHLIQRSKDRPIETEGEWVVPERSYFVMGDNRDQSQDSRFWGFVPRENLKGKAEFIWLSLNSERIKCPSDLGFLRVRWDRFGKKII